MDRLKKVIYLDYAFYPVRTFTEAENNAGLRLPLCSFGISNYSDMNNEFSDKWNHHDFYELAKKEGLGNIDVWLLCNIEVVPCENELFTLSREDSKVLKEKLRSYIFENRRRMMDTLKHAENTIVALGLAKFTDKTEAQVLAESMEIYFETRLDEIFKKMEDYYKFDTASGRVKFISEFLRISESRDELINQKNPFADYETQRPNPIDYEDSERDQFEYKAKNYDNWEATLGKERTAKLKLSVVNQLLNVEPI